MLCVCITLFVVGLVLLNIGLSPTALEKEYLRSFQSNSRTYSTLGVSLTTVGLIIVGFGLFLKLI